MKCKNRLSAPTCKLSPPRYGNTHSGRLLFSLLALAFALIGCGRGMAPPPGFQHFSFAFICFHRARRNSHTCDGHRDCQKRFHRLYWHPTGSVPPGVAPSPSSSFSLAAGASQAVTFSISASGTPATSSISEPRNQRRRFAQREHRANHPPHASDQDLRH